MNKFYGKFASDQYLEIILPFKSANRTSVYKINFMVELLIFNQNDAFN